MVVAFFDIDGTLFRNSLLIEHFKKMVKYEFFDVTVWTTHGRDAFLNWEIRKGDYEEYLIDVAESYRDALTGISKNKIDFTSDIVIDSNWEKTYVYSRERLNFHKENNHKIFFISGSPDFLVKRMAKKYNITDYRASSYIMEEDLFTGKLIPMWDYISKQKSIDDLVKIYNIDLNSSYAYGDTMGDISLLKNVGNPIAVNPNKKLYNFIMEDNYLKEKSKIFVERKDMIYEIK